MQNIDFNIKNWFAWSPELETKDDWLAWANNQKSFSENNSNKSPLIEFVPLLQRRRLSQLTKMSLKVIFECLQDYKETDQNINSVFASRYGEWRQTFNLLESISNQEELSPAGFSFSVHNTVAGLYSLIFNNTASYTSLSANEYTFMTALIEALGLLQNTKEVLLIIADENTPELYKETFPFPSIPFAIAFLLDNSPKYSLSFNYSPIPKTQLISSTQITALDFLQWFLLQKNNSFRGIPSFLEINKC